MGSHHQFQDIQGLASQQPASADMVCLGFAGAWRRSGGALPLFYHVTASSFWRPRPARFLSASRTSAPMVLSVGGVGGGLPGGAPVLYKLGGAELGAGLRASQRFWCLAYASEYHRGLPLRGSRVVGIARQRIERILQRLLLPTLVGRAARRRASVPALSRTPHADVRHSFCAVAERPDSCATPRVLSEAPCATQRGSQRRWPSSPGTASL